MRKKKSKITRTKIVQTRTTKLYIKANLFYSYNLNGKTNKNVFAGHDEA